MLIFFYMFWISVVVNLQIGTSHRTMKRGLYMIPFKADVTI